MLTDTSLMSHSYSSLMLTDTSLMSHSYKLNSSNFSALPHQGQLQARLIADGGSGVDVALELCERGGGAPVRVARPPLQPQVSVCVLLSS